MNTNYKAALQ